MKIIANFARQMGVEINNILSSIKNQMTKGGSVILRLAARLVRDTMMLIFPSDLINIHSNIHSRQRRS